MSDHDHTMPPPFNPTPDPYDTDKAAYGGPPAHRGSGGYSLDAAALRLRAFELTYNGISMPARMREADELYKWATRGSES